MTIFKKGKNHNSELHKINSEVKWHHIIVSGLAVDTKKMSRFINFTNRQSLSSLISICKFKQQN